MKSGTKYGLQLRGPQAATAAKKPAPPPPKPSIFTQDDDNDEEAVEQAIARHAAKNRALEQVAIQHKAALEQDSTVFAYDEVYDIIKAKSAPSRSDPERSKPKYITKLLDKAKARQQEQEIIYERKLLKEREREDHLYGDKDKFLTTAYKQKLSEQSKWIEEERQRELQEQADEVTKKKDLSDFYHNLLSKNVAFGASKQKVDMTAPQELIQVEQEKPAEASSHSRDSDLDKSSEQDREVLEVRSETEKASLGDNAGGSPERLLKSERTSLDVGKLEPDGGESLQKSPGEDLATDIPAKSERRPSQDALAAAKERFLARKRMRTT